MEIKNFTDFVKLVLKADGPEREFKSVPIFYTAPGSKGTKAADAGNAVADERVVEGIVAVHGNIDDGADRSFPGCFQMALNENRLRVKHLWNHSFSSPPTATVLALKEVTAAELPDSVKDYAPDATGGLFVSREYLKTTRGDEILEGIVKKAIDEMSYGYSPVKYDFETINPDTINELRIRNLREVKLWDTSDVLWGMNPATLADVNAALAAGKSADALFKGLQDFLTHVKEGKAGRRNSEADAALMKQMHALLIELEPTACVPDETDQAGKGQAGTQGEQGVAAAHVSAEADALLMAKHRVGLAEIEQLLINC
jgi:HK97 family phage prohead protease